METALRGVQKKLIDTHEKTLERWVRELEARDLETQGHTFRVTGMAVRLARSLGIEGENLLNVRRGALLHDIGKLGIPESILHKKGKLNEEEMAVVRQHPQMAYDLLTKYNLPQQALEIPMCHHEKWNGKGYPHGLKGEEIPLSARLFAIVDVYDAIITNRSYRTAMPREDVMLYLKYQKGRHFDPKVVDAFLTLLVQDSEDGTQP